MPVVSTARGPQFVFDRGAGPPLVLLHGFPLNHRMWIEQWTELSTVARVLAVDLHGFGQSQKTLGTVTMADMADDVVALLDALNLTEPVTVCGLSMGGYVTFELLRRHPSRVGKLALCNTRAAADTPEAAATRATLAEQVLKDGPRILAETMLPRLFAPSTNEDRPSTFDAVRNIMLSESSMGCAAAQLGMAIRHPAFDLLPSISLPTLVIAGEQDQIAPSAEVEDWSRQIPGATLLVLPKAGHMAPMEQPAEVNAALRELLAR